MNAIEEEIRQVGDEIRSLGVELHYLVDVANVAWVRHNKGAAWMAATPDAIGWIPVYEGGFHTDRDRAAWANEHCVRPGVFATTSAEFRRWLAAIVMDADSEKEFCFALKAFRGDRDAVEAYLVPSLTPYAVPE